MSAGRRGSDIVQVVGEEEYREAWVRDDEEAQRVIRKMKGFALPQVTSRETEVVCVPV